MAGARIMHAPRPPPRQHRQHVGEVEAKAEAEDKAAEDEALVVEAEAEVGDVEAMPPP